MRADAPPRVVLVAPWARPHGGAETMLATLLRHTDPDSVALHLVFFEDGPLVALARGRGFDASVVSPGRMRDPVAWLRTVVALRRIIRAHRADVVFGWMAKCQIYAGPAALTCGRSLEVVWWQHMIPAGHWVDRLATLIPADRVFASSDASAAGQRRLTPRRPTTVVNPGVDLEPAARKRLPEAAAGAVVVTIVGRLQPWKRQDRLLQALGRLDGTHGMVVGGSAYGLSVGFAEELHALAASLGIADRITFTGHRDDVAGVLAATDVFVNASDAEPFGIVVVEALAAGVPVVAVDAAGPRDILRDGGGTLVPSSLPEDLVAGLAPLVADAGLRERVGAEGRAVFERRFRADHMARSIWETVAGLQTRADR